MKSLNLGLAFLLELLLLAALGYWGFSLDASIVVRFIVGIGAPVVLAVIWGLFAAPNARRRLSRAPLLGFKVVVFAIGAVLLYTTGQHGPAIALEAVALLNLGLAAAWGQA